MQLIQLGRLKIITTAFTVRTTLAEIITLVTFIRLNLFLFITPDLVNQLPCL
jgi:hypothetical protein